MIRRYHTDASRLTLPQKSTDHVVTGLHQLRFEMHHPGSHKHGTEDILS